MVSESSWWILPTEDLMCEAPCVWRFDTQGLNSGGKGFNHVVDPLSLEEGPSPPRQKRATKKKLYFAWVTFPLA